MNVFGSNTASGRPERTAEGQPKTERVKPKSEGV